MQRMPRYKEVIEQMLADGRAYHCYARRRQTRCPARPARATKTTATTAPWRPEPGKGPACSSRRRKTGGAFPRIPWVGASRGKTSYRIEISNDELDDINVIARADGTPTYNCCASMTGT